MTRPVLICCLAASLAVSIIFPGYPQDSTETQMISIKNSGHTPITLPVTLPITPQARIRNLSFEKHQTPGRPVMLKITMHIQNMLRRRLVHAEVRVDLQDDRQETLQTLSGKVQPIVLEQEDRQGRIEIETEWHDTLASAVIHLTWQGSE